MKHNAELLSLITPKYGRPPLENLTGDNIDLSDYLNFYFYDQFSIGKHLVKTRARIYLEYGSGFHTELGQACDTGY